MNILTDTLNYLNEINYTDIVPLGSGVYGDVFGATSPANEAVALKIVPNKNSWKMEERVWPKLQHRNILPVINIIDVENLQCKIFVTPRHLSTLYEIRRDPEFKKDKDALRKIKKWYTEILTALEYMHTEKYCHLDLKEDNVLISEDDSAILCDFSGLNVTGKPLKRLVAPLDFRPPEFFDYSIKSKVEGAQFDMWSFGLLVLNGLTDYHAMDNMVSMDRCFFKKKKNLKELKSCLKDALEEVQFNDAFDKAFHDIWISEEDKMNALEFVRLLLKFNPKERPTAAQALGHPFLNEISEHNGCRTIGDLNDSDDIMDETSLSEDEELFEDASDEHFGAAESGLEFSHQITTDANACPENQELCEEMELNVPEKNEVVIEVKQQDAPGSSLDNISPSTTGVEREILSIDPVASESNFEPKENVSESRDSSPNEKISLKMKFSTKGTKNWFQKKFHRVFGKNEHRYERFRDTSE